jgi:hypothetical protein
MLKRSFPCSLKPVLWNFLSISVWNHYAVKFGVRVLVLFVWASSYVISVVPKRYARLWFVGVVWRWCSLVFFGLASLNLHVDMCMFEMGFLMLAEGSRSGSSLLFFLGTTMSEKLFSAGFSGFSLKQSTFQRTAAFHIVFVLV